MTVRKSGNVEFSKKLTILEIEPQGDILMGEFGPSN